MHPFLAYSLTLSTSTQELSRKQYGEVSFLNWIKYLYICLIVWWVQMFWIENILPFELGNDCFFVLQQPASLINILIPTNSSWFWLLSGFWRFRIISLFFFEISDSLLQFCTFLLILLIFSTRHFNRGILILKFLSASSDIWVISGSVSTGHFFLLIMGHIFLLFYMSSTFNYVGFLWKGLMGRCTLRDLCPSSMSLLLLCTQWRLR